MAVLNGKMAGSSACGSVSFFFLCSSLPCAHALYGTMLFDATDPSAETTKHHSGRRTDVRLECVVKFECDLLLLGSECLVPLSKRAIEWERQCRGREGSKPNCTTLSEGILFFFFVFALAGCGSALAGRSSSHTARTESASS